MLHPGIVNQHIAQHEIECENMHVGALLGCPASMACGGERCLSRRWVQILPLCHVVTYMSAQMGYGESQMLDKILYEEEARRSKFTFEQQFHYGVFFAYMRLREQEIRNLMWVSECVAQDQKNRVTDGIVYLF